MSGVRRSAGLVVRFTLGLTLLVPLAACELEPDVGPLQTERCANEDGDPGAQVSFKTDVLPLLVSQCNKCHDPGQSDSIGVDLSGLDLSGYDMVTGGGGGGAAVVAAQPCESLLYLKLLPGPPSGSRMPVGAPALTPVQLGVIHDWIAEGARDN